MVDLGAGDLWSIETRHSSASRVSRGFHSACQDLQPARKFVVHAGNYSASGLRRRPTEDLERLWAMIAGAVFD